MSVTTGIINASSLKLFVDPTSPVVVADSVEVGFEFAQDLRDITTKDSGAFQESAEGLRSCNLSATLMYKLDSTTGIDELITAFLARTQLTTHVKTANASDPKLIAQSHIYSLSFEAGVEESVSCDVQLGATGAVTFAP
jgi:hypothetical protein